MKPLILIGRCGKETLKNIFNEEEYSDKDFNYLKRRILNNYEIKILSAENRYDVSRKIEISFSFVNKVGEEEDIRYLSEKIATYLYKSEGRIYWRYKIHKYIEPTLGDNIGSSINLDDFKIGDEKPIGFDLPRIYDRNQQNDPFKNFESHLKPYSAQKKSTFGILDNNVSVDDKKPFKLNFDFPQLPEKPPVRFSSNYHSLPSKSSQTFSERIDATKEVVVGLAKISLSLLKLGILLGGIVIGIIFVIKFFQMWWSNWMLLFR